jgi:hypothetical protein
MDKILKDLFKDGENDGDITLKCSDKVNVKCHSLIMKTQSDYFKGLFDFHKDKKEFEMMYSSKLVKLLINKMYNSAYPIGELEVDEMIELIKMIDEFLIVDREDLLKSLMFSFRMSIKKENWLDILKKVYGLDCYKTLVTELYLYFRDTILVGDGFVKDDPLKDIELDTDLGRKLYKIVLQKLAHLNKQLGYNKPYVRRPAGRGTGRPVHHTQPAQPFTGYRMSTRN